MTREKKLTVLVSDEEQSMLQAIAEAEGLTVSDVVRQFARRTYAERGLGKKTKPARAKR